MYSAVSFSSYTNTTEETVQVALRAGTNLNCGGFYQKYAMVKNAMAYVLFLVDLRDDRWSGKRKNQLLSRVKLWHHD